MQWYLAKIVYRILCGDGCHTAQFDEQLRLLTAKDEVEAFDKAMHIGRSEAETFYNNRQQVVEWRFVNISELYCIQPFLDGAEVYSRITEVDNADTYMAFVHHKAENIQQKSNHHLLNLI